MKLKNVIFIAALLFINVVTSAQQLSGITGSVTDGSNGRTLNGASISVLNNNGRQLTSDVDGNFKISALKPGTYSIMISYVGYQSKQVDNIEVTNAQFTTLNVSLEINKNTSLKEVVVKTDARRENINAVLSIRRNSAVVSDVISADMIRKSPDRNTSDVLRRISGTSIQENKFVIVRGMNDRYNEAMLNGALLPSSEPDRKTFSFDIFPSEIVDNITVIKSATPELPGSFAGGLIQVNTKDVPDKSFLALKFGAGYNTITTGKEYYKYPGSSTDWLGYDNGTRKLPFENISTTEFANYQQNDLPANIRLAKQLKNNWGYSLHSSAPVFPQFQLTAGFNARSKNNYPKFGGIFALTYYSSFKFNEFNRYDYTESDTSYRFKDSAYTRTVLGSALANFAIKLNENNKFYYNNLFSINSSDQTTLRSGPNYSSGYADVKANSFFFVSNRIFNTQLGGEHFLPKLQLKIKWNAYYTNFNRSEPDYRRNFYFSVNPGDPYYALVNYGTSVISNSGVHYYAKVVNNTKGINLDFNKTFKLLGQTQSFKFGGAYYHDERTRDARFFTVSVPNDARHFNSEYLLYAQDSIYRPSNFNKRTGFFLLEDNTPNNHYDGFIKNLAYYAMFDNKFSDKLRLVWGLRVEKYHNVIHTFKSDTGDPVLVDTTYNDPLPSANFIYSIFPRVNLRLSYSRTVARPQYRELANQLFYDFLINTNFSGNPGLTETHIDNYEVRWEQYFSNAQYYSVSGFYKRFTNPIEPYIPIAGGDSRTVSFTNFVNPIDAASERIKATNQGIELEARKNFDFLGKGLENLFAYANVSLIKSKTNAYESAKDSSFRPLQGQSPYIVNAALQYNDPKTDMGISVLYNVTGPRLFLVGGGNADPVYEKIHAVLDVKLTRSFFKRKGLVELTFADILHKNDIQYWDLNSSNFHKFNGDGVDRLIQNQNFGMNISLAVGYRF